MRHRPESIRTERKNGRRGRTPTRRELVEADELTRHRRAHLRLVRVAERSCVEPLLERHVLHAAERPRRGIAGIGEPGLDSLQLFEIGAVLEELVDLDRHARAVAAPHAEERTDARREEEDLVGLGLEALNARELRRIGVPITSSTTTESG